MEVWRSFTIGGNVVSLICDHELISGMRGVHSPGRGGGLYGYVRPQRVGYFSRFGRK